jgi:hypothetical protein
MSGEMNDKYVAELEAALSDLIDASKLFTSDRVVVETSGTIPLMERLEASILASNNLLSRGQ